jgi:hypothetical protein
MPKTCGLKVLLIGAAAAAVVACGGGSSTPKTPTASDAASSARPETTRTNADTTPVAQITAGFASGATISIASPADATGDFNVDVKVSGVTTSYQAFNVYVTFDPAILTATAIKPGTALAESPNARFCVQAPAPAGAVGLGCTILQGPSMATNGVLATITFHEVGPGSAQLHLRTVAEGGAATGTFIYTPQQGAETRPDIVTLIDGAVTVS